jgi:hypothetical protein
VDHDAAVGERNAHARLTGGEQEAAHRCGLAVEAERRGILRGRFRISFRDMKSWEYQSSDLPGMVGQFMDDCERAGCIVDRDALTVESPI